MPAFAVRDIGMLKRSLYDDALKWASFKLCYLSVSAASGAPVLRVSGVYGVYISCYSASASTFASTCQAASKVSVARSTLKPSIRD